jgi:hypothetical protein
MSNTSTPNTLKSQFAQYLKDNFEFDFIKVQEHAELNLSSSFNYSDKKAAIKAMSDMTRSEYVISEVFDLINDYTDISFNDKTTLKDLKDVDFEDILDKSSEYADHATDIYHSDIYNSVRIFSQDIEDAMDEFGFPEKPDLVKIIQIGQSYFYDKFYRWSIQSLETFLNQ